MPIVDEHEFLQGCGKGMNEHFERSNVRMLLFRMDLKRVRVKP
jgi:hypothetical protein